MGEFGIFQNSVLHKSNMARVGMRDGDDVEWVCKGNADGPCASSELIIASIRHILLVSEKSEQNGQYRLKNCSRNSSP